ncbi:MAG TPA: hypothetical protein VMV78_11980 [Thiobacillus sp.]|nr:hypothetical protein [Thiobacillus sp.]
MTIAWSDVVSLVLFKLIDMAIGLRVSEEQEREGLDTASHGERAYNRYILFLRRKPGRSAWAPLFIGRFAAASGRSLFPVPPIRQARWR